MFYLFEVRDSDGNNCTVYDAIVEAPTREAASERLWTYLDEAYPKDQGDGGFATYHACNCTCPHRKTMVCSRCIDRWECSHGGIITNEDCDAEWGPQTFETYEAATAEREYYHSLIELVG